MAVIALHYGLFCHGPEVAGAVCDTLNYERVEERLLREAADRWDVPREKFLRALEGGSSSLFGMPPRERDRLLACLKISLLEMARSNDLLYCGSAGLLLDRTIAHVLRVCLIANADYRLEQAGREGLSAKEARKRLRKDDEACAEWTRRLHGDSPWDESLYDIVIPMHSTTVDQAVQIIAENAAKEAVGCTPASLQALEDALLAAHVSLALVEKGEGLDVTCSGGRVRIEINRSVLRVEALQQELKALAQSVPGVHSVETRVGNRFTQPGIIRDVDLAVPTKVLLVDDEREFVQTLSERLQTRRMEPAIAYDGEEALMRVASDEPEVMVLDLKMPGIDGIEVLRRVKKEHPDVEVIILTGHGSQREEALARELGAFAYLQKPVNVDSLARIMREAYRKVSEKKAAQARPKS